MTKRTLLILPHLLLLAGCAMTEAQRAYLERNIERDVAAGDMSEDQAKDLREGGEFPWEGVGLLLGSVGASLLGVRVWRGGVNNRKGLVAKEAT